MRRLSDAPPKEATTRVPSLYTSSSSYNNLVDRKEDSDDHPRCSSLGFGLRPFHSGPVDHRPGPDGRWGTPLGSWCLWSRGGWSNPLLVNPPADEGKIAAERGRLIDLELSNGVNMREGHAQETEQRHLGSRALHALDRWSAGPTLAIGVVIADLLWVVASVLFGFPARLETIFQTLVAATTLAMVFVIQHTQTREQAATQRKLDEILRASPEADNSLITLEAAPDNELKAATDHHRDARRDARRRRPS